MRIKHLVTRGSAAVLFAVLAVACSRTKGEEAKLRQEFSIPADMLVKDLGVIGLIPDTPKRLSLGPGKDCTITAAVLTNGIIQMNLAYESKEEIVEGKAVQAYSERSQFLLQPDMRCAPKMGKNLVVVMRPAIIK